ncbi:Hypothetical protein A7982_02403 [Minicystis rosea]|nr:Hypothetical protein A7982_02403 [Minicystis rosea]
MQHRIIAGALLLTAGCGLEVLHLQPVKNRASLDLGCPAQQIEATVLERKMLCIGTDDLCATSVVAKGCGQQTVYVRVVGERESSPWMRNGDTRPTAPQAPAPPAAAPAAPAAPAPAAPR